MSKAQKIILTLVVVCLMLLGFYFGTAQANPTLTPGFGASGSWGCPGGSGTTVIDSTPIVQTPVGTPTPGFGITG